MKDYNQFLNENITHVEGTIFNKNSVSVDNNPIVLNWMVNCITNSHHLNKKSLAKNLVEELTTLFGKPNRTLRLEFMMKLWILKYKDITFNIFTAKNKGTYIEICDYTYNEIRTGSKQKEILEFLEELHKLINEI
jgi:hypothetical protein